uniref:Sacsin/Nov domain-containing protein n=1 Tax=Oryza brachyantha TaxID=4533 RepID=J3NDD1_ORYBR
MAAAAREHVERIRRERFYIGREERNPLADDIHQAVTYLSQELYSKDVHFLMELIQSQHSAVDSKTEMVRNVENAEDNQYPPDVRPALEFVIIKKDITATGAASTLLVFNNEQGFSAANIESICRIGKSTKKGNRHLGYIGEKGIGFKSVFLVSSQPHIFSNGYQIKFNEEPSEDCDIGYIVPKWVDEKPSIDDIQAVYGYSKRLPTTTIILPLKSDKILPVKKELSSTHPEILLFLSKIRQLSVREVNDDPKASKLSQISISSEVDYRTQKDINAESYTLHLAMQENKSCDKEECTYYMWKQTFVVKPESRDKKRMEVDKWVITLAFPHGQRLSRGARSPGVYAFLPTEMVTNLPFIIQADFLLASSRESILFDSQWNRGILNCVPSAFVSAFEALLKSSSNAPSFALPPIFRFLPIGSSSIPMFDSAPEEFYLEILSFIAENWRLKFSNTSMLDVPLIKVVTGADSPSYCSISGANMRCMRICIASNVNELPWLIGWNKELSTNRSVFFLPLNTQKSLSTFCRRTQIIEWLQKIVRLETTGLCEYAFAVVKTINEASSAIAYCHFLYHSYAKKYIAEGRIMNLCHAMPLLDKCGSVIKQRNVLLVPAEGSNWFTLIGTNPWRPQKYIDLSEDYRSSGTYAGNYTPQGHLITFLRTYVQAVDVPFMHPPNASFPTVSSPLARENAFLLLQWIKNIRSCNDNLPQNFLSCIRNGKWLKTSVGYKSPSESFLSSVRWGSKRQIQFIFSGVPIVDEEFYGNDVRMYVEELRTIGVQFEFASANLHIANQPLTKDNAILLLQWMRDLRLKGVQLPHNFMNYIRNGSWLKTSIGYSCPSESFLLPAHSGNLGEIVSGFFNVAMIDQEFYENKICSYKDELQSVGVRFEFADASAHIVNYLTAKSSNGALSRANMFVMLQFIRNLTENKLTSVNFIEKVKKGCQFKTFAGNRLPVNSILFNSEWENASVISLVPFIDTLFYGEDILDYKAELVLLGVRVGLKKNYQMLVDNFRLLGDEITPDVTFLILKCLRYAETPQHFVKRLKELKWLKTCLGFRAPPGTFLVNDDWKCLLTIVDDVPLLDLKFYGDEIRVYGEELSKVGLIVGFVEASKAIVCRVKKLLRNSSFTKEMGVAMMECYRELSTKHQKLPVDLVKCMKHERWIHTSLGLRAPPEAIIFSSEWECISKISNLPFINDEDYSEYGQGKGMNIYRDELMALGAKTELKHGASFVILGLKIPYDASAITPEAVISLLKCIRSWMAYGSALPENFMSSINTRWVKTTAGYRHPKNCLLFGLAFSSLLHRDDGPFVDEVFYGQEILSYESELRALGVIVDSRAGCALMAQCLKSSCNGDAISRIYLYLEASRWKPRNANDNWIWVPEGSDHGQFVNPDRCVLYDRNGLFSSQLHVLVTWYEYKLLRFFKTVFDVKGHPTIGDYRRLWIMWQNSNSTPPPKDCTAFFEFVEKNWNPEIGKYLAGSITKVPGCSGDQILLLEKQDVFIPDDLLLEDLFSKQAEQPLFVWYPPAILSLLSPAKLNEIYSTIGVQKISKVVTPDKAEDLDLDSLTMVRKETVIKPGLLMIILAFLADPVLDIPAEKRHEMVSCLTNAAVYETVVPLTVSYQVRLSSGRIMNVKSAQLFRWEREELRLFITKNCGSGSLDNAERIQCAAYFAEEISKGLLFDRVDRVHALADLMTAGFLLDFDVPAVQFLLKFKNLRLLKEDEQFCYLATFHG